MDDPYASWLGIQVDEAKRGHSTCSVVVTEKMLNFLGLVHGGLLFSLADVAFSVASNMEGPVAYAIDVNGSFFKSAKVGDTLIIHFYNKLVKLRFCITPLCGR